MKIKPCPFCGNTTPKFYFADDEGEEINLDYARYNGDCDPDDEKSIINWLKTNQDAIAYFAVIACPCGITLWNNHGANCKELTESALKIWNKRVIE